MPCVYHNFDAVSGIPKINAFRPPDIYIHTTLNCKHRIIGSQSSVAKRTVVLRLRVKNYFRPTTYSISIHTIFFPALRCVHGAILSEICQSFQLLFRKLETVQRAREHILKNIQKKSRSYWILELYSTETSELVNTSRRKFLLMIFKHTWVITFV